MVIVPGIRTTLLAGLLLVTVSSTGCVGTGSGTPSVTPPPPPPETFITTTFQSGSLLVLQNQTVSDTVRIGLETNWGGSIVEVSLNGTNYVNAHDTGREIQPAFYDGNAQYDACAGRAGIEVSSWITTSGAALSIASMTAAGSSASATTGFAPMARRMPTLFGVRVMPVTACPALSSTGTSLRPMAPVAPATKTLILQPPGGFLSISFARANFKRLRDRTPAKSNGLFQSPRPLTARRDGLLFLFDAFLRNAIRRNPVDSPEE